MDLALPSITMNDSDDSASAEKRAENSHPLGSMASDVAPLRSKQDSFNLVYLALLLVSMGVLFPWNSFVSALDYFIYLYRPEYSPEIAIPITYLLVTLLAISANTSIINFVPVHIRIGFGYVVFILALTVVMLLEIGLHNGSLSASAGFWITLAMVLCIGIGSGVQQSSLFGLAGILLKKKYTQALMVGESVAGMVVALIRVMTKATLRNDCGGALIFFGTALAFIFFCVGCHLFLITSPYVKEHLKSHRHLPTVQQNSETYDDSESNSDQEYIVDKTEKIGLINDSIQYKSKLNWFKDAVLLRIKIIRKTWQLFLTVFLVFVMTLMVFPGLTSEVQYCSVGTWSPVILVLVFNFFDFIGRWLSLLPIKWNLMYLVFISIGRFVLVPLLVLCVSPSPSHPVLQPSLVWAVILVMIVGVTNGIFGTLPVIMAPRLADKKDRELTGTFTVMFLLAGLCLGSLLAYALHPLTTISQQTNCTNATVFDFANCTKPIF